MSIRRFLSTSLSLAALLVVLTGCGAAGTPAASGLPAADGSNGPTASVGAADASQSAAGNNDPCALVTAAEAQTAMGVPVATTKPKGSGAYHVCDYASADGRTILEVTRIDPSGDGSDKTTFDLAYGAGQPVAGVGGDAYFNADLSALTVWLSGTVISVGVSNASGATAAQMQAALTKVALAALARL
jgi:hypothetical protein